MKLTKKLCFKITLISSVFLAKFIFLLLFYLIILKNQCDYLVEYKNLTSILDIEPPKKQSIFFLGNCCEEFFFTKREACSVEAASRLNRKSEVFVLYSHPIRSRVKDSYLNAVLSYENVNFIYLNVKEFVKGTPLEKLFHTRRLNGNFVKELLGLYVLYKYGGIYLDFDVFVLRNLKTIFGNFIGFDGENLSTSIMGFERKPMAHNYIMRIIDQINLKYNGEISILPFIIELLQEICDTKDTSEMVNRQCTWFKVHKKNKFYPLSFNKSQVLYKNSWEENIFKIIKGSYTIRTFSKNFEKEIPFDSSFPYVKIAKKYCPKVMSTLDYI